MQGWWQRAQGPVRLPDSTRPCSLVRKARCSYGAEPLLRGAVRWLAGGGSLAPDPGWRAVGPCLRASAALPFAEAALLDLVLLVAGRPQLVGDVRRGEVAAAAVAGDGGVGHVGVGALPGFGLAGRDGAADR